MKIIRSFSELREVRNEIGGSLGLVPTMGALHDGHLSLVRRIAAEVDEVMVSIFVNPAQFGPGEDFVKYPRSEAADVALLEGVVSQALPQPVSARPPSTTPGVGAEFLKEKIRGKFLVDYVYIPTMKDIYPSEDYKKIHITGELNEVLEAKFRPTHFDGVATVVNILFNQTGATHAIFGEKDYQQLLVIKQMVADLSLPVEILQGETLREADGLAMSSRNKYLSTEQRKIAPLLYQALINNDSRKLEAAGFKIQYFEEKWGRRLAAVYLGETRLIDNIALGA